MRSSRNDRPRQSRRRGFDDDTFYGNTPPPPSFPVLGSASSAAELEARVKWYNAEKGFGFIALADGSGDVFLHVSVLEAAGLRAVSPGTTLRVRVGQGQKGRQVDQVVSVDESTAEQPQARAGSSSHPGQQHPSRTQVDLSSAVEMTGTVKWYNPNKGFGFITPQDGGKDVFVHASAVERSGLAPLQEGQSVRVKVVQGARAGRSARSAWSEAADDGVRSPIRPAGSRRRSPVGSVLSGRPQPQRASVDQSGMDRPRAPSSFRQPARSLTGSPAP